jgi:hypothetical protein
VAKRNIEVSDEILEHIADVIAEMTNQVDCWVNDRMVDIDSDTEQTIQLTPRIEERYTAAHAAYYAETVGE